MQQFPRLQQRKLLQVSLVSVGPMKNSLFSTSFGNYPSFDVLLPSDPDSFFDVDEDE